MAKREALKTKRICVACGEEFLGTAGKLTCSGRCRSIVARLKKANKRPSFMVMAKSNGQKIPDLSAPKRLRYKKGEKMKRPELPTGIIDYKETTESSFDGEEITTLILDELGQFEKAVELTKEAKTAKIYELEQKLKVVQNRQHQMGDGHPKMFALQKDEEIKTIKKQLEKLQP